MKKNLIILCMLAGVMKMSAVSITSPDGQLVLDVTVDSEGTPVYTLDYKGKPVIKESRLGLRSDETAFLSGFHIVGPDTATVVRTWPPVGGVY